LWVSHADHEAIAPLRDEHTGPLVPTSTRSGIPSQARQQRPDGCSSRVGRLLRPSITVFIGRRGSGTKLVIRVVDETGRGTIIQMCAAWSSLLTKVSSPSERCRSFVGAKSLTGPYGRNGTPRSRGRRHQPAAHVGGHGRTSGPDHASCIANSFGAPSAGLVPNSAYPVGRWRWARKHLGDGPKLKKTDTGRRERAQSGRRSSPNRPRTQVARCARGGHSSTPPTSRRPTGMRRIRTIIPRATKVPWW